jgi:hypothetical protein
LLAQKKTNDLPFLVLTVSNGELVVHNNADITPLAFPAGSRAVEEIKVTIIGRVLLSTDTVPETKQVNSSKITRDITLFRNPVFAPTALFSGTSSIPGASGVLRVTLANGGQFVNRSLILSDFVFSGISTTGLSVERLSNNEALIYGFAGNLATGSGIGVAAKAMRIAQAAAPEVVATI